MRRPTSLFHLILNRTGILILEIEHSDEKYHYKKNGGKSKKEK